MGIFSYREKYLTHERARFHDKLSADVHTYKQTGYKTASFQFLKLEFTVQPSLGNKPPRVSALKENFKNLVDKFLARVQTIFMQNSSPLSSKLREPFEVTIGLNWTNAEICCCSRYNNSGKLIQIQEGLLDIILWNNIPFKLSLGVK